MYNKVKDSRFFFLLLVIVVAILILSLNHYSQELVSVVDALNTGIVIILILIPVFVTLSFIEIIRLDLLALMIPVVLVLLKPWTKVSVEEALSGFSNSATITVLAMFIISQGIQNSGIVQVLGKKIIDITGDNKRKQLGLIMGLTGPTASMINNTPVVAAFIPMITNLAKKTKNSPSRLLIPMSYASMLGGMFTLIGTSTNILASNISDSLIGRPFSMFEFTHLGVILFLVGFIYLFFIGAKLIPARIDPEEGLTDKYEMDLFLTEVIVKEGSPFIGVPVNKTLERINLDIDLVQVVRSGEKFKESLQDKELFEGDHLIIRSDRNTLLEILDDERLKLLPEIRIGDKQLEEPIKGNKLLEVVVTPDSFLVDQTFADVNFIERYDATILAIKRGPDLAHKKMEDIKLKPGDIILLFATKTTVDRLQQNRNFIVVKEFETKDYDIEKIPISLGILAAVVIPAILEILPIVVSALGGMIAMILTDCVNSKKAYDAIDWEVIFLLAGLIPLGIAMEKTGTAQYIADMILIGTEQLPPVIVLGLFYFVTVVLTNFMSNNASAVLMLPVAVEAANTLGANPFSFIMAVTFAASTAFLTPLGYQTNLMVYGPGGYKFKDFFIVGAPLQIILTIITPILIKVFWGV
ncbi:SLC13 family permease [Halonatronum saccharophilum]|uniref:SLC13 family permease n=1 Tax=Halonatronum saccharophilum TaxID=150060 RepID=UPI00048207E1|nr:SLC13 family permease [Halonatronum saccharophilum]